MLKIPGVNVYEHARQGILPLTTTAEDLIATVNKIGESALYFATKGGKLKELAGGVTAEQLIRAGAPEGLTALHFAHTCASQIKDGVTSPQLQTAKDPINRSALHAWADAGSLLAVNGGVTFEDLLIKDDAHIPALQYLILCRSFATQHPLAQIQNGVTEKQLAGQETPAGNLLGLVIAMHHGRQVTGGVSVEQLMNINHQNETGLHTLVKSGVLDQTIAKPTLEQLILAKDSKGYSALYAVVEKRALDYFPDLTQYHLGLDKQPNGKTSLHRLAEDKKLHLLSNGVSREFLEQTLSRAGDNVLKMCDPDDLRIAESKFTGIVHVVVPKAAFDPFNL